MKTHTMIKIKLIIIFILSTSCVVYSQSEKVKMYKIKLNERGVNMKDSVLAVKPLFIEEINEIFLEQVALKQSLSDSVDIQVIPSSSQGAVFIKLNKFPLKEPISLKVLDPLGRVLGIGKITSKITRINLWGKTGGDYIIEARINNTPIKWVIDKR